MTAYAKIVNGPPALDFHLALIDGGGDLNHRRRITFTTTEPNKTVGIVLNTLGRVKVSPTLYSDDEWEFQGFCLKQTEHCWFPIRGKYSIRTRSGWFSPHINLQVSPTRITHLSEKARNYLAEILRTMSESGWKGDWILDAASIGGYGNLLHHLEHGKLEEVSKEIELPFYRLLTFLGLSKDQIAEM